MTSKVTRIANRRNSRSSTGPKTSKEKKGSSQNVIKPSAYTQSTLPGENSEQFKKIVDDVRKECESKGRLEDTCAYNITRCIWFLDRLMFAEQNRMADHVDGLTENRAKLANSTDNDNNADVRPTYHELHAAIVQYVLDDPAFVGFEQARAHLRRELDDWTNRLQDLQARRRKASRA
jgi:hypothetical protein